MPHKGKILNKAIDMPFRLPLQILTWLLLAYLFGGASASADNTAGESAALSRIGFVDIPYLIDKAPQAVEAEQRLETEFAPRQAALKEQRDQLAELTAQLNDNTLELPEADQLRLDRESRSLERRIKRSY